MMPELKKLLAKHRALVDQRHAVRRRRGYLYDREREICAEGRAVQFQLLLHMPCRQFFRIFNINKEAGS